MAYALCIVILASIVSVNASRDESDKVNVSVKAGNFQLLKPAESVDRLDLGDKVDVQPQQEQASMTAEEAEEQLGQAAGEFGLGAMSEQSNDLSDLQGQSMALRDAVDGLSASKGLTDAEKIESMQNAKYALQMLTNSDQHAKQLAQYLDQSIHSKYKDLLESQLKEASTTASKRAVAENTMIDTSKLVAAKEASIAESKAYGRVMDALERQLATMDSSKESVEQFYNEVNKVKQARDQVRAQKAQLMKAALEATEKDVEQHLSGALAAPQASSVMEQEDSQTPLHNPFEQKDTRSGSKVGTGVSKAQMDAIERAAHDVMGELDELQRWREKGDSTIAGIKRGGEVKANLDKHMKVLEENQANENMNMVQVGHLKDLYDAIFQKMHSMSSSGDKS